jgi:murein L,D-transpeptidase YafK
MKQLAKMTARTVIFLALLWLPSSISAQFPNEKNAAIRIAIMKSARTMTIERSGLPIKTFKVALGGQPIGAKQEQGDHKTPEGEYYIDAKNAHSQFYMALHLSYPNAQDRVRARKWGVNPGGDVEIHGLGKKYGWIGAGHRLTNWTDGYIAVTNEDIEDIFQIVPVGTHVVIKP